MIISLAGDNYYALQARLKEIVADFSKKHGDMAIQKLDAYDIDLPRILEAVQTTPLFSKKQLIILRQLSLNKPAAETIEQIISSISELNDLVIYEPEIDRRSSYFKELKASTELEEFQELSAPNLA